MKANRKKKVIITASVLLFLVVAALVGGSMYLLNFALSPYHRSEAETLDRLYSTTPICAPGWIA